MKHTSHGEGWFDPKCAACQKKCKDEYLRHRDVLIGGMLETIQEVRSDIRTADEHCKILWQWFELIKEHVKTKTKAGEWVDPNFKAIADVADIISLVILKSSYLGRRLYGGEAHRDTPCPEHKGQWSGLPGPGKNCEYGCDYTGWIRLGKV